DGKLVEQVGLMELNAVGEVSDALEVLGARPAHHAMDLVALLQEPVRQIAAVLSRNACNDSLLHGFSRTQAPVFALRAAPWSPSGRPGLTCSPSELIPFLMARH